MINLTVTGDASGAFDLLRNLEKDMADAAGPMGDAFTDGGTIYLEAMRMRYGSASRGDGTWKPLKPATIARKKQNKDLVLVEYGDLYTSLIPGDANNVLRLYDDPGTIGVFAGTADPVAVHHQYGEGRLPARPIIVAPDDLALTRIANAVRAGVASVLANLRGGSPPALGISAAAA